MSIALGGLTGYLFPEIGKNIGFLGTLYVDLLKMIILPFMLSAVIFSLRSIFVKSENMGELLQKILKWYVISLVVVAAIGVASALLAKPGSGLDEATLNAFGNLIQSDKNTTTDMEITLSGQTVEAHHESTMEKVVKQMIPSNIFAALSYGDTVKVLVFALLFGLAIGHSPAKLSDALTYSLETVYTACQRLTQWFNLLLPVASFSMAAEQLATTGLEPMRVMLKFLEVFLLATCVVLALSIFAIWRKSGHSLGEVLSSQQESFFMA
ncbi:MAG: cation:dicarboxylase symporter family transporter, partial [Rectinemataceae bacterium]|nr:cation:dicarboxylase symporter family transporter [Rectinemataceae bacterium]